MQYGQHIVQCGVHNVECNNVMAIIYIDIISVKLTNQRVDFSSRYKIADSVPFQYNSDTLTMKSGS